MAWKFYLKSSDFTFSGGGRAEAGALYGAKQSFFSCVQKFPCVCCTLAVCALLHTSIGHRQLSWVLTWWGMVAALCPVMDEGGGGDFPRGRLAPGSYDLSRALLSFCWAPLQSHSLQRLLSQGWGQGLSNPWGVEGWQAESLPQRDSHARAQSPPCGHAAVLWSCAEED